MNSDSHEHRFLDALDTLEHSQRQLLHEAILSVNAESAYGKEYTFNSIESAEEFATQVPLINYEHIRERVELMEAGQANVLSTERTVAFFQTSGSLSKPKNIPVTASLMRQKVAAFATFWGLVYEQYPAIRTGSMVSNFSDASESFKSSAGIEICSESSFWARRGRSLHSLSRWPLPKELRLIKDTPARLYAIARLLLQSPLHCIMCLNPSTLLQFCQSLDRHREELLSGLREGEWGCDNSDWHSLLTDNISSELSSHLKANPERANQLSQSWKDLPVHLKSVWPELELIICWSSEIVQPYFKLLEPYTHGINIRDYITQSSECIMAIPAVDNISGGLLAYQTHFFEFIRDSDVELEQPETRFAWQLELGERYEVVVTTGGGLYRYRMGDCVVVNGYNKSVPVIEFLYRFGKTSSMTGEKLTESQVLHAADSATQTTGITPTEYLLYPCDGALPRYGLIVEVKGTALDDSSKQAALRWGETFDVALMSANGEYSDKCASERIGSLQIFNTPSGTLLSERLNRKAAGVSDEQVKSEVLTRRFNVHDQFKDALLLS